MADERFAAGPPPTDSEPPRSVPSIRRRWVIPWRLLILIVVLVGLATYWAVATRVIPIEGEFSHEEKWKCDFTVRKLPRPGGFLVGTLHNGTDKTIRKVVLSIKTDRWQRDYDVAVKIAPLKTGSFRIEIVDEDVRAESFDVKSIIGK
jgi:hypothetical protein